MKNCPMSKAGGRKLPPAFMCAYFPGSSQIGQKCPVNSAIKSSNFLLKIGDMGDYNRMKFAAGQTGAVG